MTVLCSMTFMAVGAIAASAQNIVKGTVKDSNGETLVGVTVIVNHNGETTGTMTDADGRYSITADEGETIEFSSIGFITQKIIVGGKILSI